MGRSPRLGLAGLLMVLLVLTGLGALPFGRASWAVAQQPAAAPAVAQVPAAASDQAALAALDASGAGGEGSQGGGGHSDPVAPILLWLVIIWVAAKLGGDLFDRMGQPAVLGELVAGVLLGNVLFFLGHDFMTVLREGSSLFHASDQIAHQTLDPRAALQAAFPGDAATVQRFLDMHRAGTLIGHVEVAKHLDIFSRVGVILLLFLVGLESNLSEMMKVGLTSLLVAVVGVIAPFVLGYVASLLLMPAESVYVHIFVGATLTATSVGITARVFKDLEKLQTQEAKIILGAAVIDDVLGLIILAVVQGVIVAAGAPAGAGSPHMGWEVLKIILLSVLFLGGSIVIGARATPFITRIVAKMQVPGMKLIYSLAFAFTLAWLADRIGLASIVGAFAAGLVLDDIHFKDFRGSPHRLDELVEPIATVLVPIFFVMMGVQVKLETFAEVAVLGIAAGITVAAVIGKQVCGLVIRDPAVKKAAIGVGMIPRGEVGLIFAAIGKTLTFHGEPVVNAGTFSAVVIMVIVTTLMTPPILKVALKGAAVHGGPPVPLG